MSAILPDLEKQAQDVASAERSAKILATAGALSDTVDKAYKSFIQVFRTAKRTIDDMEVEN